MELFNKEKDLIFKIANLVLIIWLVASATGLWIKTSELIIPQEKTTYEEYYNLYCNYLKTDEIENTCKNDYKEYIKYENSMEQNNNKQIWILIGNIFIIKLAIFFLNRKKGKQ